MKRFLVLVLVKKRKFWNSFDFFHVDIIFAINFDLAITFEPLHFFCSVFRVDLHFSGLSIDTNDEGHIE